MLFSCDQKQHNSPVNHSSNQQYSETNIPKFANNPPTSRSREVLIRAVYGDLVNRPELLENQNQSAFLRDIFEGLVGYDTNGNIVPAVAESWQTEDNKNWVFILRENAKWSNGEPVTAEDFVKSWQKLALSNSPLKNYLAFMNIKNAKLVIENTTLTEPLGISAIDKRILLIELDKATPYLPEMLVHSSLLPQYFGEQQGTIGNGAYQVLNQENDLVHLIKNSYYWDKQNVSFNFVDYKKITDEKNINNIDLWINPKYKDQTDIHFLPKQCLYFYTFNFSHQQLQHLAIRQALKAMISNKNITPNHMLPLNSILPRSLQQESQAAWSYVLVEKLLKEANITEKVPLRFKLVYDNGEIHSDIAKRLTQMWSQSDLLRIDTAQVSYDELLKRRATGDFDLIRAGWCSDYKEPSAFLNQFHSHSADNQVGYNNPRVDELLDESIKIISPEKRTALYQQIVDELQKDVVILPIFQYTIPYYWHSSVLGINDENDTGVIYSKDLYRKLETQTRR
ncbi:peptide ABC transporter substrate-binding protein [Bisgaardia hudsonensis]|nr:peptide ABC transporter substrate-binding protein [Bisgaardia hudsonensis]